MAGLCGLLLVLRGPPILCLVSRGSIRGPGTHPLTPGHQPRCPQLPHRFPFLLLPLSESKKAGREGAGLGMDGGHYCMGAEVDGRSRRPLP